jgi:hypothetical protein
VSGRAESAGRRPGPALLLLPVLLFGLAVLSRAEADEKDEVQKRAETIASIHQLSLKKPVKHLVVPQDKLLDRIRQLVFIDYTKEEIIDEGRMMSRIGLFPSGVDYEKTIFQLLEEQVIGLYDTHHGELLLTDSLPDIMQDTTVDHEITHAVQDQNFNLSYLMKKRKGEGDMKYALSAVFEGDALLMEEVFMGGGLPEGLTAEGIENVMMSMSQKSDLLVKVPAAVRKSLLFPYSHGYIFMKKIFKKGGFHALNSVLSDPPKSTEQILHPDAYASGDDPESVTFKIPKSLSNLYRTASEDVMGEFTLKSWLEEFIDPLDASLAADGWEGDWFTFLWPSSAKVGKKHLGRGIFVMVSLWEPSKPGGRCDACEFFDALASLVKARWKPAVESSAEDQKIYRNLFDELIVIKKDGERVLYVEGLPASLFSDPAALADAILSSG